MARKAVVTVTGRQGAGLLLGISLLLGALGLVGCAVNPPPFNEPYPYPYPYGYPYPSPPVELYSGFDWGWYGYHGDHWRDRWHDRGGHGDHGGAGRGGGARGGGGRR
jgi:hypothetical protein